MEPRKHRHYSARQKAQAVGIAVVDGTTLASEATGIPASSIAYWVDQPAFVALREKTRELVAVEFWSVIQIALGEVAKGIQSPDEPLRDKTIALGILYDKYALMKGEATARTETRALTEVLPDHEREALADAIDAWLKERADAGA